MHVLTATKITHANGKNTIKHAEGQKRLHTLMVKINLEGLPPLLALSIVAVVDSHAFVWALELG